MKFDGLIVNANCDPYYNLAAEEVMMSDEGNLIMIWRNSPSVIIGRHQNTYKEVDRDFIRREGIPVIRRLTGGGAVYHDLGNINISFVFDVEDFDEQVAFCSNLMMSFLKENEISAYMSGRNDICVSHGQEERKISGCAMMQRGSRGLFHATLLFDTDTDKMARALTPDISKLKATGTDSVRSRVANIRELTYVWKDTDAFEASLIRYFHRIADQIGFDYDRGGALKDSHYGTWTWNYGRDPECNVIAERKFSIGNVELNMSVKGGIIKDCFFTGDYIDVYPLKDVADAITGQRYDKESVEEVLKRIDCSRYFGESREEIVKFIMKGI